MIWQQDEKIWNWLPRLQAHRGYWVKGVPQNSIESIKSAYEIGYEISEFDVRLTGDGEAILFHDKKINGRPVYRLSHAEVKKHAPAPRLEELFDWFKGINNFKLNIELKNDGVFNYRLEKAVCKLIKEYGIEDRVLISSFNPLALAKVRVWCPSVYRALLLSYEREHGNNVFVMSSVGNYLCYPHVLHMRSEDFVKYANNYRSLGKKIPIILWTVNDLKIYEDQKNVIHGIISDEITPQEFKNFLF